MNSNHAYPCNEGHSGNETEIFLTHHESRKFARECDNARKNAWRKEKRNTKKKNAERHLGEYWTDNRRPEEQHNR